MLRDVDLNSRCCAKGCWWGESAAGDPTDLSSVEVASPTAPLLPAGAALSRFPPF